MDLITRMSWIKEWIGFQVSLTQSSNSESTQLCVWSAHQVGELLLADLFHVNLLTAWDTQETLVVRIMRLYRILWKKIRIYAMIPIYRWILGSYISFDLIMIFSNLMIHVVHLSENNHSWKVNISSILLFTY